ncbi:MAG: permease-like cell division protein FtsX [Bacteroidales bacterium]
MSSIISISLVLMLVGIVGFFAVNAKQVSNYFKENMIVSVILKQNVTEENALKLLNKIDKNVFVKSAEYISKERGAKEMEALLGEDFLKVFESNPIPISIDLQLEGDYLSKDSLSVIENKLMKEKLVEEVVYQESLVEMLNANLKKIGIVLTIVIILLMFISFVLINNTVRLNVYSKRFTIHTMRLVGATRGFIRRPIIVQALLQGLISGILACIVLSVGLFFVKREFEQLFVIFDVSLIGAVLFGVVILGMIICVLSAFFVVNKLVYLSKDDLYY